VNKLAVLPKRLLVGRPLHTSMMGETLLPKKLALPVFCSDPLSSNAYATEEILLMLSLGVLSLLHLAPLVAGAVVLLLVVVVLSYRQTCHAYPDGGGAYAVSRANLGRNAALVAASALLVDYVLTVAVSVAAGVANIVSALPFLAPHVVILSVGLVLLLALMNLRGTKESGKLFAIPTYGFVVCVFAMLGFGLLQMLLGHAPVAESATIGVRAQEQVSGLLLLALVLRAFASGCTALTGVEAVSNGVPNFKKPKSRNAAATLTIMGALTILMFVGITTLALVSKVHVSADPSQLVGAPQGYSQRTVIAQIAGAVFGNSSLGFYAVQAFTAAILVLGRQHRVQRVPDPGLDRRTGRVPAEVPPVAHDILGNEDGHDIAGAFAAHVGDVLQILHNHSALGLKARLLFQPGVMVTSVPFRLDPAEIAEARRTVHSDSR
jgi:amino acid transporter